MPQLHSGSSAIEKMRRQLSKVVYKTSDKKETVFAFIDAQNIAKGIESAGWKINWSLFRQWLADEYNVAQAHMYIGYMMENRDLYLQLNNNGFIVNLKETLQIKNVKDVHAYNSASPGDVKGNVDVDLTIGVWREYDHYDKAIIMSGDGDFSSLIQFLLDQQKLKALIVPGIYSSLFKQFEPHIVHLNNYRDELLYVNKNKQRLKAAKAGSLQSSKRQKLKQILTHEIHLPRQSKPADKK